MRKYDAIMEIIERAVVGIAGVIKWSCLTLMMGFAALFGVVLFLAVLQRYEAPLDSGISAFLLACGAILAVLGGGGTVVSFISIFTSALKAVGYKVPDWL